MLLHISTAICVGFYIIFLVENDITFTYIKAIIFTKLFPKYCRIYGRANKDGGPIQTQVPIIHNDDNFCNLKDMILMALMKETSH